MEFKTSLFITLLAACIIPSISHADETGKEKKKASAPAKVFMKFDTDKSGSLSVEEVIKNKSLTKKFAKADLDANGTISLAEFTAYNKARLAAKKKRDAEKAATTTAE
ncbi:MAG: EF-hand domain-containing protein [Lentimonas sp.]